MIRKILFKNNLWIIALICFGVLIIDISCSLLKKDTTSKKDENSSAKTEIVAGVDTEYYSTVEKEAGFQNGNIKTFASYLKKNTKYPAAALKKNQQGTVVIQFGIDCYGSIKVFSTLKSSGFKLLDNEALRAINSSPKWNPAKIKDKSVGQLFILHVKFNLKTRSIEIK